MTKTKKNYRNEIIFFVLIMLICFLIFNLGGKKILASEHVDGQINLDLWTLGEIDSKGNATLTDYQIDDNLKDIVIPNAVDFIKSNESQYQELKKVYITRATMNKAAENGDKEGGSLKISDTGVNDNLEEDETKVFAEGGNWSYTFSGTTDRIPGSFNGYPINSIESIDLASFDTSNITDMSLMFSGCGDLTSLDVSNFDTKNVTDMSWMFSDCGGLTNLDVSSFDTSHVTGVFSMFSGCSGLTSLDVSNFNTKNVTNMSFMFCDCSGLTSLDVSNFDSHKVTSMYCMFSGCSGLTNLDVSNFDTRSVTNMSWMFYNCSNLLYLDLAKFNLENSDRNEPYKGIFAINEDEKIKEPLLITTNDEFLKELTRSGNNCQNRMLFTTTLKVDGNNVKFKGDDESEFVKYNNDKTEKYINFYTTYTTMDSEEEILQKLADRLEEEKKNLIVVPGYENLEWEPESETEGKVSYSLQNVYTIKKVEEDKNKDKNKDKNIEGEAKNYNWSTIENSGGNLSSSSNKNLISNNESTNTKINTQTKSDLLEKLRTRKYLFGYPDGKIKPENYVTNAEFATVIYRLMNGGEEINYDKLENIGIEKSDWFADAVVYLMDDSRKIINVTGGTFNPNKNITGYEMLNIIHNVLKFYDADKNLVDNQNLNSNVTRAEMTKIIFEAFDRKNNLGQKIYLDLDNNHWAYKFLMDASE